MVPEPGGAHARGQGRTLDHHGGFVQGNRHADPPTRITMTRPKPSTVVFAKHIEDARKQAAALGGQVGPKAREWQARGFRACDGFDPEGNVFQVRETAD